MIEENRTLARGRSAADDAPYLTTVAKSGALFTHAHGVTHPSLPNYFALFAGLTNDNGDGCPGDAASRPTRPNLASELLAGGLDVCGVLRGAAVDGLPRLLGRAVRAQARAVDVHFTNVPQQLHQPLTALRAFDDARRR